MATAVRICVMITVAEALLFIAWFPPEKKSWVKEWAFPITGLVGWIILIGVLLAVARIGAACAYSLLWPSAGSVAWILTVVVMEVGAIWAAVISTQLIENAARFVQGLPPRKIQWIKKVGRKRKPSGRKANS